jgi:hypothetical protein
MPEFQLTISRPSLFRSKPGVRRPEGVADHIRNNIEFIPNFGERYRQGETISTAFVESTINQVVSKRFVKKQQIQWTPRGAHFLLQTRTKVLNDDLEDVFRGWYPQFHAPAAWPSDFLTLSLRFIKPRQESGTAAAALHPAPVANRTADCIHG